MVKLAGAIFVLTGSWLVSVQKVAQERRHIRQLNGLSAGLEAMRRQLLLCAAPMEELLLSAERCGGDRISGFFQAISLSELEKKPFAVQWDSAAEAAELLLTEEERRTLSEAGQVLGQAGLEEQCACLQAAAEALRTRAKERAQNLAQNRRLWYTLSASAGLLAVVTLL